MAAIVVVGAGFVGTTTATVLARAGHAVRLVEADAGRRAVLESGRLPFFEPGLEDALAAERDAGRVVVAPDLGGDAPQFVFLCVGTPSRPDGSCDTSQVARAAADVAEAVRAAGWTGCTVVVKSTVPPGTTRTLADALAPLGAPGTDYGLAMNPEFLREGSALADAVTPDRVVVGALDGLAADALTRLYADAACPVVVTDPETAELVKYAANGFLATKVSFANEIGRLAEAVGVDVDEVMHAVGLDPRIGDRFLQAGPGFGGSCFPKDVAALRHAAAQRGIATRILDAVDAVNTEQPLHVVDLADALVGQAGADLAGKTVVVLGLAFKAGTSDVRGTRALPIVRSLQAHGATVRCHDPRAADAFRELMPDAPLVDDARAALAGADLAILHTDWPEYEALLDAEAAASMRTANLLDTRRVLDPARATAAGFRLRALGVGSDPGTASRREVTA